MNPAVFDPDDIVREVRAKANLSPLAKTANLLKTGANFSSLATLAALPASQNEGRGDAPTIERPAVVTDLADHFAKAQRLADAKNRDAARRSWTDKYCRCGAYAPTAWRIDGRETWLCDRCRRDAHEQA